MCTLNRICSSSILLILFAATAARADEPEEPKPAPWVGAWRLASMERAGVKAADSRPPSYFVVTKDTITGMNVEGEVLSLLSYRLDGAQTPAPITLTTEKPFPGETR